MSQTEALLVQGLEASLREVQQDYKRLERRLFNAEDALIALQDDLDALSPTPEYEEPVLEAGVHKTVLVHSL